MMSSFENPVAEQGTLLYRRLHVTLYVGVSYVFRQNILLHTSDGVVEVEISLFHKLQDKWEHP